MLLRTPRDIGAIIKQRRKDKGLDQAALAELIGVSRWWVNEIERGKPGAELGLVLRALNALGVRLSASVLHADAPPSRVTEVLTRARRKRS